jgi:hypothetical protein
VGSTHPRHGEGAEKKTSVSGGGGGRFAVHRCGGDGWADGTVPRRGDSVDLRVVEAIGEAPLWTWWWWWRSGRHRHVLIGVEEHVEKFGSLSASSPNPLIRV